MTESEFTGHLQNVNWNTLFWSRDGVYRIVSINTAKDYILIEPINSYYKYGKVELNVDNCDFFHSDIQNPEIAFAMNVLKNDILREIQERLSNF